MGTKRLLPQRQSVRLRGEVYAGGVFFITVCTFHKRPTLATVTHGQMVPTPLGRLVEEEWLRSPTLRPGLTLDAFVLMPNHVHAVVWLPAPQTFVRGSEQRAHCGAPLRRAPRSLASFVAQLKGAVTVRARQAELARGGKVWQRGYYEHAIRDEASLEAVRQYISGNPFRWDCDPENPRGRPGELDLYPFLVTLDSPALSQR